MFWFVAVNAREGSGEIGVSDLTPIALVAFGIHAVVRPRDYSFIANRGKWDEMEVRLAKLIFT